MKSIIYIERNNLYFYGSNVHAPIAFPFQPTIIRDLEVINPEELEKQLTEFIKNNKIEPAETMIILAHQSSFEKTFPPKTTPEVIETEKKHFLDYVPFSQTLSQVFTNEKGIKIIAANKDLIYRIRDIFNKHQFNVEVIASVTAVSPDTDISFSAESAQDLLKKSSILKQNEFPIIDTEAPVTDSFAEGFVHEKNNNSLYIMLGVLLIGIVLLVYMYLNQQKAIKSRRSDLSPTPPHISARKAVVPTTETPVTSEQPPSAVTIPKESLTVQILNGSSIPGQADSIKAQLEAVGYKNIATGNSSDSQSTKTLIVYRPRVSPIQRQEISEIVTGVLKDVATQENAEISVDILITTSQPAPTP